MKKKPLIEYVDDLLKNGCSEAFIEAKCYEKYRVYNMELINKTILQRKVIYLEDKVNKLEKFCGITDLKNVEL